MAGHTDTIFALASGVPPSGVAVVRVSGPGAGKALQALTAGPPPPPRRAMLRSIRDPATGQLIDKALVLLFRAPASFTGEEVAEIHAHGGPAVVAGILAALAGLPGLRPAEAGEFTRRAFLNGRIDLTQAEALADLIAAETAAQRDQALAGAEGRLRHRAEAWRARLVALLADVEADLDFADEADVAAPRAQADIAVLAEELAAVLADAPMGERVRSGLTIAVAGPPNAGKSSLVNALARREVAIVTPIAGTTRDVIEVRLDLGGVPATLLDTAGLRDSSDPVEALGIARARDRAAAADLVLNLGEGPGLRVVNRIDATGDLPGMRGGVAHVSALTGAGIPELERWLVDWARTQVPKGEPALVTHERQRYWLGEALAA
ncbi:MAG: tRNA uridine-5-carboxymethylaminomethyl(34) synthesis GTPase MnmE, partial [Thermaurantiacus sp.]